MQTSLGTRIGVSIACLARHRDWRVSDYADAASRWCVVPFLPQHDRHLRSQRLHRRTEHGPMARLDTPTTPKICAMPGTCLNPEDPSSSNRRATALQRLHTPTRIARARLDSRFTADHGQAFSLLAAAQIGHRLTRSVSSWGTFCSIAGPVCPPWRALPIQTLSTLKPSPYRELLPTYRMSYIRTML